MTGHHHVHLIAFHLARQSRFRVTGGVPNTQALRWWLLGFGDKVRIQAPRALAEQLQGLLFDPLTRLLGRLATEEYLHRLLAAARRGNKPLALALVAFFQWG